MKSFIPYILNVNGQLIDLAEPCVMGILNATPDSFYAGSRKQTEAEIAARADQIMAEGGKIIDVGAFSTRPGAAHVTEEEEMERMRMALKAVRSVQPDAPVSVDTFRPEVARMAVEEFGAGIIMMYLKATSTVLSAEARLIRQAMRSAKADVIVPRCSGWWPVLVCLTYSCRSSPT